MSDAIQSPIGPLRSAMQLTLHTRQALRIWQGRPASESKTAIMGFLGFAGLIGRICHDAERDDPYADYWLIRIEEKLHRCKVELTHIHLEVDLLLSEVPSAISAGENFSIRPVSLPMFIGSPFGFLALYLLITYDGIVRRLQHARHVALIGRKGMESRIDEASYVLRSLFGLAQQYKFAKVTRADFAADNERAREAREAFGELPLAVLEGRRRAEFAPRIIRGRRDDARGFLEEEGGPVWYGAGPGQTSLQAIPQALEG
ncbi:PFL_4669 family integrating conjugative element protein [Pseudomonas vanderleydeniana]|uniref:TIGR03761 family integrating conjugative element protein n=1 Tax=Pseudomonas vanderleydeniana TaxID=2745495 RepID=A0A9E6TQG7_9PSED|nr:TIGR03761 family integrating conjugative element protein [Pseudomonas vanderleydeniana]QXI26412.1 TIGR03761 family integrating conjugative element protein [Pseudomonas vanderleydeniana]